jgi:hypothetical protein
MRRFEGSEYVDADHIEEVSYWWPPKHEAYKATKPAHTPTLARRQFVQQAAGRYWWPLNSFMGLDSDLRYKSPLLPLSLCQPHTHTHTTPFLNSIPLRQSPLLRLSEAHIAEGTLDR